MPNSVLPTCAMSEADRQPLDFIVFDARTRDEFIQRLGRAGRVLGRKETQVPSDAIALLPEGSEALAALQAVEGQTLSRAELRRIIRETLPPRHDLYAYLRSYAVLETFRPLHEIRRTLRPDLHEWIDRLFEGVCRVFMPTKQWQSRKRLSYLTHRHNKLDAIIRRQEDRHLSEFVDEAIDWLHPAFTSHQDETKYRTQLRQNPQVLRRWAEEQYKLGEALFNFREVLQGPMAVIYDPQHLLSDTAVTMYDALHVAANFEAHYFEDASAFERDCQVAIPEEVKGEGQKHLYCHLRSLYLPTKRRNLGLAYREVNLPREAWERLHTRRPVVLRSLALRATLPDGTPAPLAGQLPRLVQGLHIPCLIIPPEDQGRLLYRLQGSDLYARPLTVTFRDGTEGHYRAIPGTAAFIVHADMYVS